jgi:hypothetical protein
MPILTAFCPRNQSDYNTIMTDFGDTLERGSGINCINSDKKSLDAFQPPMSRERLQSLGFDCWLIDLIDAPPSVMIVLCEKGGIHRIPVSLNAIDDRRLNSVSEISTYIAGAMRYSKTTSKYGNRLTSTRANKIRKPWVFVDQGNSDRVSIDGAQSIRTVCRTLKMKFEASSL